jgi:5-deoxy-glucuronate isomerase
MSKLLVKPSKPDSSGRIHTITPESAGWTYVGFEVYQLKSGQSLKQQTGNREACIVMLSGRAHVGAAGRDFGTIGGRASPFETDPWSLYAPAKSEWSLEAETDCEIAVCTAPAEGKLPARVIRPDEVGQETRGKGTNTRHVRNILPETETAESLLVVEVITPSGHWSSYPPHKHDRDMLPHESLLEETYYHRLNPPSGFALQRVYTDNRSLDETLAAANGDVVLVPKGYHPVGAPHGYELYYLNVMAGPKRVWKFHNDPDLQLQLNDIDRNTEKARDVVACIFDDSRNAGRLLLDCKNFSLRLRDGLLNRLVYLVFEKHHTVVLAIVPHDLGLTDEFPFRNLQLELGRHLDGLGKDDARSRIRQVPHGTFHPGQSVVVDDLPLKKSARARTGATLLDRFHGFPPHRGTPYARNAMTNLVGYIY